mgnify:CR=1 FL=1
MHELSLLQAEAGVAKTSLPQPAGADPRAVPTRHLVLQPRHFGEFRVPGLRQLFCA